MLTCDVFTDSPWFLPNCSAMGSGMGCDRFMKSIRHAPYPPRRPQEGKEYIFKWRHPPFFTFLRRRTIQGHHFHKDIISPHPFPLHRRDSQHRPESGSPGLICYFASRNPLERVTRNDLILEERSFSRVQKVKIPKCINKIHINMFSAYFSLGGRGEHYHVFKNIPCVLKKILWFGDARKSSKTLKHFYGIVAKQRI